MKMTQMAIELNRVQIWFIWCPLEQFQALVAQETTAKFASGQIFLKAIWLFSLKVKGKVGKLYISGWGPPVI